MERSGTSLMYVLLASHPNLAMTRRTNLWKYFYNQYGDLSRQDNLERCLRTMMRYKRVRVLEPDLERIRREFWLGEPTYARLFALIEEHYAERLGKPRWGDKSLNTEQYVDHIFTAYSSAKMIHMIRDPRDRYASARTRWRSMKGKVSAATAMWLSSIKRAERNQRRYPDRYKIVRYETLVAQPEETLREICEFIGEKYSPAMLTMEGTRKFRDTGGNSSYGQRKPGSISTNSLGRFRQMMSKREIAFMQTYAQRHMVAWNYQLDPIQLSLSEQLLFYLVDCPLNMGRMIAWHTREAVRNTTGHKIPSYRIIQGKSVGTNLTPSLGANPHVRPRHPS
jgi:hypothetical protein